MSDDHFMRLAIKEAEKACTMGEVPVGAVLVINKKIIAAAHNLRESLSDPTAHAEVLAIREGAAKTGDWSLPEGILYVTKEPCIMCAGVVLNARLGRLVYGCRDDRYGAVTSRYQLLHDPGLNHQVRVIAGVLENECAAILRKFFLLRR